MHNMTHINQFIAHPGSTFNDATNATVIIGKDVTVSPSSTSNNNPNAGISDCVAYLAPGRDKIDLIRIINAIAEMNPPFFINNKGDRITKKALFEAFGSALGIELNDFANHLSAAKRLNNDSDKNTQIFDELKKVSEDYFNK